MNNGRPLPCALGRGILATLVVLALAACTPDLKPDVDGTAGPDPTVPDASDVSDGIETDATVVPSDPVAEAREMLRRADEEALDEEPDSTFRVGYGHRDLPWRAGAKPGQIGTEGLPARDILLGLAVSQILRTLAQRDPVRFLTEISAWATPRMAETLDEIEDGQYNVLFRPGRGVEEPPAVSAFVLSRGETHVAVVSADLYLPHEQLHRRVAHLVAERTGINRDRLFLVATHNHSAPHSVSPAFGIWTFGDQFDARHWVYMTQRIAEAVEDAWNSREPATVRTARTTFRDVQRNILGVSSAPVSPEPDADEVEVQTGFPPEHFEDDLIVIRFDRADDAGPIGHLFVLGMHPETLRDNHGIISGEFNRMAERKIAELTGSPSVWISGALGDVEPDSGRVNEESQYWRGGFSAMDEMTDVIAEAVSDLFAVAGESTPEAEPVLLNLARDLPGPETHPVPDSSYLGPRYRMVRLITDSIRIRIHLVRIHDVLLVGSPAEVPTDQSLNLKSRIETGASEGDVYQGYVFPDAPAWVAERIAENFATNVASSDAQVPIVAAISLVNTYMGYIVTRWEYENREHYRESLTMFGPGTADHVNTMAVALNEELHGGPAFSPPFVEELLEIDMAGFDEISLWLRSLDDVVRDMARAFPASDASEVGTVLAQPELIDADPERTDGYPERLEFSFIGGTNDVDMPRVTVEMEGTDGTWETVGTAPSFDVFLLFEAPDRWTASWRAPLRGEVVRFSVEGVYRGAEDGASDGHPIWDPDGRNVPYSLVSEPYEIAGFSQGVEVD